MIDEAMLKSLLERKAEMKNLDFKQAMDWSSLSKEAKCEIVKDILAFMNTQDGGQIVFGVEDSTMQPVGLCHSEVASFDITKINDFLHKYTDPQASCEVQKLRVNKLTFVVIDVPEFTDLPVICKADGAGLLRGRLYIRTDKASSEAISTSDQMRELLSRAMLKRGDQLLRTIRGLLVGDTGTATPSDPVDAYSEELSAAVSFMEGVLPAEEMNEGYFEVWAMPISYVAERIPSLRELAEAVAGAEVSLRGWNFPHMDRKTLGNFDRGRQSHTVWNETEIRHIEAFRVYTSGLFVWRSAYQEEAPAYKRNVPTASWVNIVMEVTEYLLFLIRFYARVAEDATIMITIRMTNTKGRQLMSYGYQDGELQGDYVCLVPEIEIKRSFPVSQLRASFEVDAKAIVKRVFEVFQWMSPALDGLIDERQRRLIERQW